MKSLALNDIKNIYEYNRQRTKFREKMVGLKRIRTLSLGPSLLVTFENRETLRYYIQEAVRAERALKDSAVQQLIDMYTPLLPGPDELCGVIQLHITKKEAIQPVLHQFELLTHSQTIWFEINDSDRVYGTFESDGNIRQPAYVVRFHFSEHTRDLFCHPATTVSLVIRHESYHAVSPVQNDLREELMQDLKAT